MLDWLLGNGSESWLDLGDFARAASMAREAMEIAEGIGDVTTRCLAECALCRVSVCEGNLETAIPLAERWIETASIGAKFQLPWALSTLAVLRSGCGERDEARRLAHEALAVAESGDFGTGKLRSELALARICLDAEDAAARDEAAGWLTRAEQTLNTTGAFRDRLSLGRAHRGRATHRHRSLRTRRPRRGTRALRGVSPAIRRRNQGGTPVVTRGS